MLLHSILTLFSDGSTFTTEKDEEIVFVIVQYLCILRILRGMIMLGQMQCTQIESTLVGILT